MALKGGFRLKKKIMEWDDMFGKDYNMQNKVEKRIIIDENGERKNRGIKAKLN